MSPVEETMDRLAGALRVRGRARHRFLQECRDHLEEAASKLGEQSAVGAFGSPEAVASEFDAEIATRRAVHATASTTVAVLAVGASTLVLLHGATDGTSAPLGWALCFFVAAQLAAVCTGLALVQSLALRRTPTSVASLTLLHRRGALALVAAGGTMFSAGAALPGSASALPLLVGPFLALAALVSLLRSRSLAARLTTRDAEQGPSPWQDVAALVGLRVPDPPTGRLLAVTTALAAVLAFVRDRAEHATLAGAAGTAGLEVAAVVVCFLLLGRHLGLRPARRR